MLSTRDPPQNKGHIQTESEGLEKKYFMQMETKNKQTNKPGIARPISDKIDFKCCEKRQRRTLHNDQKD